MQNIKIFTLLVLLFYSTTFCSAQSTYPNDPLQRRIYVLDNGLTVCLSENHREPRIACALAIRAGSGIETDSTRSLAFLAAKNLLSDEYTQLMKTWNAAPPEVAVSYDWCTMLEEFPANYLEQWTVLLHERLDHPAFRLSTNNLFRITDMINGAQRNDHQRAYDTLRSALYPNHPYGLPFTDSLSQQLEDTTISKLTDFYLKHYTPSNIILCLSGDFHTKEVLNLIDKHLGKLHMTKMPYLCSFANAHIVIDITAFVYEIFFFHDYNFKISKFKNLKIQSTFNELKPITYHLTSFHLSTLKLSVFHSKSFPSRCQHLCYMYHLNRQFLFVDKRLLMRQTLHVRRNNIFRSCVHRVLHFMACHSQ